MIILYIALILMLAIAIALASNHTQPIVAVIRRDMLNMSIPIEQFDELVNNGDVNDTSPWTQVTQAQLVAYHAESIRKCSEFM